jgi:hypothetical protein
MKAIGCRPEVVGRALGLAIVLLMASAAWAENRSFDGTGNNLQLPNRGVANKPLIRVIYGAHFLDGQGNMITDAQRPNARTISNALSTQSGSVTSARGLSDYIWAWGQFLDHDMSLSTSSAGGEVNGYGPIAVNDPNDPLGPNPIPLVRSNFVPNVGRWPREQMSEVTAYIDASQVYGSDAIRAAALRTAGGTGAKLILDANGLLPRNTLGLPNDNDGPLPDESMFLAGDVRANENVLLTSLQTVFAREHNRLVDRIAAVQPSLAAEDQYQLARKIVGAEMQIVTYREFLPALMGPTAPKAEQYDYSPSQDASVTQSFAHAAYRFGHSTLSPNLKLVAEDESEADLPLRHAFFNPTVLADDPGAVDRLLRGAAYQVSQEVDLKLVDDVRNFLFGPPGAGGLDLAALNIQRGRDHGLPHFTSLSASYSKQLPAPWTPPQTFPQITSNVELQQAISAVYDGNLSNIDAWVGGLAEDHVAGSSLGRLFQAILNNQFRRTRDGDRLFYLANAAGLYTNGVLNPEIAQLVDLDGLRLSDIIEANTSLAELPENLFYVMIGDFDGDGVVGGGDLTEWLAGYGGEGPIGDADGDGDADGADFLTWQWHVGMGAPAPPQAGSVPEPGGAALILLGVAAMGCRGRVTRLAV